MDLYDYALTLRLPTLSTGRRRVAVEARVVVLGTEADDLVECTHWAIIAS